MSMIRVKTVPGRLAYTAPRGGKVIPTDRYVEVEHTAYVDRLLNFHQDIEQEPPAKKTAAKSLTE
jgi:hypothetical protein